jgi:hypothetical protein
MNSHRKITPIIAGFAILLLGAAPAAWGGSLLSGYGGPGQGNQAILGSTLLNGRGGGGGGNSGSGGPQAAETSSEASQAPALSAPATSASSDGGGVASTGAGSVRTSSARHGANEVRRHGAAASPASNGAFSGYTVSERAAGAHPWLGISGEDLLYVVLVLGVLAFTGVLTGRFAGGTRQAGAGGSRGAT